MKVFLNCAFLSILFLSGCSFNKPPPRHKLPELSAADCQQRLKDGRAVFASTDLGGNGACTVQLPVRLDATAITGFTPALKTSCGLAAAWLDFEQEVDKLAKSHLGSGIKTIRHYGSFSCRRMSGNRRRMSLHSTAQALDIAGFEMEDGSVVSVKNDWNSGSRGKFLKAVSRAACGPFAVVLTPNHDRDHHDHIHIDIGPWSLCGI